MLKKRIGVMQGRLSLPINGKVQSFPTKTWKKEFMLAKKLSFKFIEWTLDYKNLNKNPLLLSSGQEIIRKLCNQNNITINSITGDCFMQHPFWKANKLIKKKLINQLKEIIDSASKIKIKFLVIPLVDNGRVENTKQKKNLIKEFKKMTKYLKKKKVTILFETDLNPLDNLKFLKNFNNKYFGLNYDIGNSASLDFDPIEEFKNNAVFIKNIHIKDRKKFGNTVPLGKGNADFKLISKLCKKYSYKGNFILQTARKKSGTEFETLKAYLNFIQKKFI